MNDLFVCPYCQMRNCLCTEIETELFKDRREKDDKEARALAERLLPELMVMLRAESDR